MSTNPVTAPFRTAYVRGTDGLYYKIGSAGGGGGGEDEVHVGSAPPAGPFPGQMWVDLTGSGGGETDVYADEVYVNSVPPVTPFNGQVWIDLTGAGSNHPSDVYADEVYVGTLPPATPFPGQLWIDLTGDGGSGSSGGGSDGTDHTHPTDTSLIPKALVDAKGDLLVGAAVDAVARLSVGANGYVLTASSTAPYGVAWAAPTGGGGVDEVLTLAVGAAVPSGTPTGTLIVRYQ